MFYKWAPVHCVPVVRSFSSRPVLSSITQLIFGWGWDLQSTEVCTVPFGSLRKKKNLMTPRAWLVLLPVFPSCLPLSALLQAPDSLLSFTCSVCATSLSAKVPLSYECLLTLEGQSRLPSSRLHTTQQAAARARNPPQQLTTASG